MAASTAIAQQGDVRSPAVRATRLAERQFGAIARRQLLACGFERGRVESWIRTGRLHPRHPGVYAIGRRELGTEGVLAAALLYAGPGSALGGLSALWWMGLLGRRPIAIHVDAPGNASSRPGVRIRHPAEVPRTLHRDLPVSPFPRSLLTAAEALSHDSLRLVLARAEFRSVLDLGALHASLGPGRTGSAAVRAALAAHLPQLAACASPLERDFLLLCERHDIPLPQPNARIGRWRPDMLWSSARLIVELDGEDAPPHPRPARRRRAPSGRPAPTRLHRHSLHLGRRSPSPRCGRGGGVGPPRIGSRAA